MSFFFSLFVEFTSELVFRKGFWIICNYNLRFLFFNWFTSSVFLNFRSSNKSKTKWVVELILLWFNFFLLRFFNFWIETKNSRIFNFFFRLFYNFFCFLNFFYNLFRFHRWCWSLLEWYIKIDNLLNTGFFRSFFNFRFRTFLNLFHFLLILFTFFK